PAPRRRRSGLSSSSGRRGQDEFLDEQRVRMSSSSFSSCDRQTARGVKKKKNMLLSAGAAQQQYLSLQRKGEDRDLPCIWSSHLLREWSSCSGSSELQRLSLSNSSDLTANKTGTTGPQPRRSILRKHSSCYAPGGRDSCVSVGSALLGESGSADSRAARRSVSFCPEGEKVLLIQGRKHFGKGQQQEELRKSKLAAQATLEQELRKEQEEERQRKPRASLNQNEWSSCETTAKGGSKQ
ncbi:unnamed protein product, partial [Amoebophrya sp. A120]